MYGSREKSGDRARGAGSDHEDRRDEPMLRAIDDAERKSDQGRRPFAEEHGSLRPSATGLDQEEDRGARNQADCHRAQEVERSTGGFPRDEPLEEAESEKRETESRQEDPGRERKRACESASLVADERAEDDKRRRQYARDRNAVEARLLRHPAAIARRDRTDVGKRGVRATKGDKPRDQSMSEEGDRAPRFGRSGALDGKPAAELDDVHPDDRGDEHDEHGELVRVGRRSPYGCHQLQHRAHDERARGDLHRGERPSDGWRGEVEHAVERARAEHEEKPRQHEAEACRDAAPAAASHGAEVATHLMRLGPRQHLVHAESTTESTFVGPFPARDELLEQSMDLHHRAAERARSEGEKREKYR